MNAPLLVFTRLVTQRFERYCRLNRVTVVADHALRIKDEVDAVVFAVSFGHNAVTLNAKRIQEYEICLPLIVKGVDVYPDKIVAKDIITTAHGRADLTAFLFCTERDIEIF